MKDRSGPDGSNAGSGVPAEGTTAEEKRLAARRRFLVGGAASLPLILTLGQREAWAASAAVCQSLGMGYDWKYAKEQQDKKKGGGGYYGGGYGGGYDKGGYGGYGKGGYGGYDKGGYGGHKKGGGFKISAYCDPKTYWKKPKGKFGTGWY